MKLQINGENKKYINIGIKKNDVFYDLYFVNPDTQSNNIYLDLPDDIGIIEDILYFDDVDKEKRKDMLKAVNRPIY